MLTIWLSEDRHIQLAGHGFSLLNRRITLAQHGAVLMDLVGSVTMLYLFLPVEAARNVVSFFGLFVVAIGTAVLSQISARVGAFEGAILIGLQGVDQSEVPTAVAMYRVMRTILPFLLASLVLGAVVLARYNPPKQLL